MSHIQNIPLTSLSEGSRNVRKTGNQAVDELAASISAHGLLQNLTVIPSKGGFEVIAGGRRLRALQLLAKEGRLPAALNDDGIACLVIAAADASERSLAENIVRQAMHPADEFDAFHALAKTDKLTAAEIAERFGVSEKHVSQRLRLGNVAPDLVAEYRAGDATLEQMMALALVDDHVAQRSAWKAGEKTTWYRDPSQLRRALIEKDVSLESALGRFVGIEAYEAGGGTPRKDLFSDFASLPDSKLVNKIAMAKLEDKAAELRKKGWGWVETRTSFDYSEKSKYRQQSGAKPDAKLGVIVAIDSYGKFDIQTGLVKPGEKAPASTAAKKPGAGQRGGRDPVLDKLHGIRTAALRVRLRDEPDIGFAALAASMAFQFFRLKVNEATASVMYFETALYHSASLEQAIKANDPVGTAARAAWEKRTAAGVKKHGSIFRWLMSEPGHVATDLLGFLSAEMVLAADDCEEADVHKFAADAGVRFADHWTLTATWLGEQTKAYVLAAVTEACGKDKATPLDKLKPKDFPAQAYTLLSAANWTPALLRAPEPPKPIKKATTKAKGKK